MAENKEEIAYLSDIEDVATTPKGAVPGHFAEFGTGRDLVDSGKSAADFVGASDLESSVRTATAEIWSAVNNAMSIAAYGAPQWVSGTSYTEGEFCRVGSTGYRCKSSHVSGESFDPEKWTVVLTESGKEAIDSLLDAFDRDGLAALIDIAPAYDADVSYTVGMMVVKDGVLQVCTRAGRGPAAEFDRNKSVESSVNARLNILRALIPEKVSELENDAGFVTEEAIPKKVSELENDAGFVTEEAIPKKVSELENDAGFVTEEEIPKKVSELENDAGFVTEEKIPYRIVRIQESSSSATEIEFTLHDKAVNLISANISGNQSIRLVPPENPVSSDQDVKLSRDFYVVINLTSERDVRIYFKRSIVNDCFGQSIDISARANATSIFRLTDSDMRNSVFIVTGFGDAAHRAALELERALDDIISDYGGGVFTPGMFLQDDVDPSKYHKLVIVTDEETGSKNLGVDQKGVFK